MGTKKTDNHYTADKIRLRADFLPEKDIIKVLDCFGGKGVIWAGVQRISQKSIVRHAIDKRADISYFHWHGDNVKVLKSIDLFDYDIIDLDAYGIPFDQLDAILNEGFKGSVFVTAIQTMHGTMPIKLLEEIGFTKAMIKKVPSLFGKRGWQYLKEWLAFRGVRTLHHRSKDGKHYFYFHANDVVESLADYDIQTGDIFANLS